MAQHVYGSGETAERVTNTTIFPYRVTCRTVCISEDGTEEIHGTAAIVGPKLALTSAHTVFNLEKKYKYLNWTCYPAYNKGVYKDLSCGWSRVYYSSKWMESSSNALIRPYDWAICVLEKNLGDSVGWFGVQSYGSNSELNNVSVKLTGYPSEVQYGYTKTGIYQYETGNKIDSVNNNMFSFSAYTAHGFSGGPVRRTSDNFIVGVNQGKDGLGKPIAVRITQEMINIINDNR